MAEFCSRCDMFDEPDYDLFQIALSLEPGRSETFLCEGCNIRGVHKDDEGQIYLAMEIGDEIKLEPTVLESLIQ